MLQGLAEEGLVKSHNTRDRADRSLGSGQQGLLRCFRAEIEAQGPAVVPVIGPDPFSMPPDASCPPACWCVRMPRADGAQG